MRRKALLGIADSSILEVSEFTLKDYGFTSTRLNWALCTHRPKAYECA
jgi:hypothetical protein